MMNILHARVKLLFSECVCFQLHLTAALLTNNCSEDKHSDEVTDDYKHVPATNKTNILDNYTSYLNARGLFLEMLKGRY